MNLPRFMSIIGAYSLVVQGGEVMVPLSGMDEPRLRRGSGGFREPLGWRVRYIGAPCGLKLPARFFYRQRAPVQSANFIYSRNKRIPCVLYPTRKQISGEITMPTPKEYRQQACEC